MKAYKQNRPYKSKLKGIVAQFGETIEQQMRRIMSNKDPIRVVTPIIYTERKDGVLPEFNVRTDTWDLAIEAMDIHQRVGMAKREERHKIGDEAAEGMKKEGDTPPNERPEAIN